MLVQTACRPRGADVHWDCSVQCSGAREYTSFSFCSVLQKFIDWLSQCHWQLASASAALSDISISDIDTETGGIVDLFEPEAATGTARVSQVLDQMLQ